ncbi:unnamed protein product [Caenorhabditis bovis]|uniref:Uncharacterized protein n=1 Tax=Caenorhabditis bovis TaxID=2654633 RepID=A0A8S1EKK7_9PELO|nr:unnamed protein product [Caenorhabditis bovis]
MDLLDLYHAHDYALSEPDEEVIEEIKEIPDVNQKPKQRKAKFVPWEPYKAAVSHEIKGTKCPDRLPELIAYSLQKRAEPNNNEIGERVLTDTRKLKNPSVKLTRNEEILNEELKKLTDELRIEQKINEELKRLMIATLNEELQGQVEALTEDKIRLAHRVDEYMGKLVNEDEQLDQVRIDRDIWKCKFLAQSIRCDELTAKNEFILKILLKAQEIVRQKHPDDPDAKDLLNLDLKQFFARSPCEEIVRRNPARYTNLTISCCKNCSGKEIQLL